MLAQHLVGVAAQRRRGAVAARRRPRHRDHRPHHPLRPGQLVLEVEDVAHRLDLRVVGEVLGEVDLGDRGALAVEDLDPLVHRLREEDGADALHHPVDELAVARGERVEVGSGGGVVLDAEGAAHLVAVERGEGADHDAAVLDGVAAVEEAGGGAAHDVEEAAARVDDLAVGAAGGLHLAHPRQRDVGGLRVEGGQAGDTHPLQRHAGLQQRRLDVLALAGALAVEEGGRDRHRAGEAGVEVGGSGRGDDLGRAERVDLAVAGQQAGVGLRDGVGAGTEGARPLLAEAGVLEVDEVGPEGAQRPVVHAQALRHARAGVDHEHVEARDDAVHQLLRRGMAQVDDERALAAVERVEALALAGHEAARLAAALASRRLDLDHVRPEVGEVEAAVRPRHDLRDFEHLDPVQRARHGRTSPRRAGSGRGARPRGRDPPRRR